MPEGEVIIALLGLVVGVARPGEGEGEALSKGLLRHALPGPVVDMLPVFPLPSPSPNVFDQTGENQFFRRGMVLPGRKPNQSSDRVV